MTLYQRQINLLIICAIIASVIWSLYLPAKSLLLKSWTNIYLHGYNLPSDLTVRDIKNLDPAQAVPILMYHGVVSGGKLKSDSESNTERKVFIKQMETLKREGFETISISEYDLFRQGKFTLPAKPIILTFDDGRRDSYYTTDKILEKLGFKATIFVASIKSNQKDPFYLDWEELKLMQSTGRWEIEAHGQRSHEEIPIDADGTLGKFLTYRKYIPGVGLESIADFEKRVETDYVNHLYDLKSNLNIEATYFAIPLNDYGDAGESNYEGGRAFNELLTKRYFRLAFNQVYAPNGEPTESFYNYADSNPYEIKRLEVENISGEKLLRHLNHYAPSTPDFGFPEVSGNKKDINLLYGKYFINESDLALESDELVNSARILFGDTGWRNYSVVANIERERGRSASIIVYYTDENNHVSMNWSGEAIRLIERLGGKERELAYYNIGDYGSGNMKVSVRGEVLSAYFNALTITSGVKINLKRGAVGFGVWDPSGAKSILKDIQIYE